MKEQIKDEKLQPIDLEVEDAIWVNEFNEYQIITEIDYPISGKTVVTFENGKTLFFDNRRRFKCM